MAISLELEKKSYIHYPLPTNRLSIREKINTKKKYERNVIVNQEYHQKVTSQYIYIVYPYPSIHIHIYTQYRTGNKSTHILFMERRIKIQSQKTQNTKKSMSFAINFIKFQLILCHEKGTLFLISLRLIRKSI